MMKFVNRINPIDVLIINRTEDMTSVDCITQLGNESEVDRKEGDPQLKEKPSREEKTIVLENSWITNRRKLSS